MNTPLRIICHLPVCSFLSKTGKEIQQLSQWLFHPICSGVSRLNVLPSFSTSRQQHCTLVSASDTWKAVKLHKSRQSFMNPPPSLSTHFHQLSWDDMDFTLLNAACTCTGVTWCPYHYLQCSIYSIPMQFSVVGKKTFFLCYASQWKNIVWLSIR